MQGRGTGRAVAAIVSAFAAAVALIGVGGDFPLGDDWAYAWAVRSVCEQGRLDFLPWTGASVIAQVGWGAAACKIFGFDFAVLRATTLVASLVGVLASWSLARRCGAGPGTALLVAAAVGFNPVWLNLSFTFMTDVPFAAIAAAGAVAFAAFLERGRGGALAAAAALFAASALIRQHGVFVAGAAALALVADSRRAWASRIGLGAAVSLASVAALGGYSLYLASAGLLPQGTSNKLAEIVAVGPLRIGDAAFRALMTLGLFVLPLAVARRDSLASLGRPPALVVVSALAACTLVVWLREGAVAFYLPNLLWDFGLGALPLRDTLFLGRPLAPSFGLALCVVVTAASLVGAALAVLAVAEALADRRSVVRFVALAAVVSFAASLLQARYYFDRYLLVVLPLALAAIASRSSQRVTPSSLVALAALGIFAVAGTHDSMAWNRARWQALAALEARGVDARQIDGGMEYNAWRLAGELRTWPSDAAVRPRDAPGEKSWWWVVGDEWTLAFTKLEGYRVEREIVWPRWLAPGRGRLYVLRRSQDELAGLRQLAAGARGDAGTRLKPDEFQLSKPSLPAARRAPTESSAGGAPASRVRDDPGSDLGRRSR